MQFEQRLLGIWPPSPVRAFVSATLRLSAAVGGIQRTARPSETQNKRVMSALFLRLHTSHARCTLRFLLRASSPVGEFPSSLSL